MRRHLQFASASKVEHAGDRAKRVARHLTLNVYVLRSAHGGDCETRA